MTQGQRRLSRRRYRPAPLQSGAVTYVERRRCFMSSEHFFHLVNMKRSRYRAWCFTTNNPTDESRLTDDFCSENKVSYAIYSRERGKSGTPHFQGYVYFANPRTLRGVKRLLPFSKSHLEPAIGNASQNLKYITKDEPLEFSFGDPPRQGKRTELKEFTEYIRGLGPDDEIPSVESLMWDYPELIARYEKFVKKLINAKRKEKATRRRKEGECPEVFVFYGPTRTGKTSKVFELEDDANIYKLCPGDGSANSLWFDDYQGESVLLLDDFYGYIKYSFLLTLLDRYVLRVQCKGGYETPVFERIYITSNVHPREWYTNVDDTSALMKRLHNVTKMV